MEEKIINLLNEIAADFAGQGSPCEWTKEIKRRLVALGKKHNCKAASSDVRNANYSEWLCDLIWWHHEEGCLNKMTSIELAMESKWSGYRADIENDFLKLVYAKAKLKLFIFGVRTQKEYESKLTRLEKFANMCEDKNHDKYLISCTIRKKEDGKIIHEFTHKTFTT